MKSALRLQFGDSVVYVLDLFHFLEKLRKAKQKMEGICYGLINAVEELLSKIQDEKTSEYEKLLEKMNSAIEIFDRYERLLLEISKHVYLCNHENGQYVDSETLEEELLKIAAVLKEFHEKIRKHKKISSARSYIENNLALLTAYKKNIEKEVRNEFPELSPLIFQYFLAIIENIDQFQRSYENSDAERYWAEKILDIKQEAMLNGELSENEFDALLNKTAEIVEKFAKSNSFIENVNNQIRRFLDTYKSIPSGFCDLFSYYWNHRVFSRGKRKGYAPIELLTNKKLEKSWLDLLLDKFPYDKVRVFLVTV